MTIDPAPVPRAVARGGPLDGSALGDVAPAEFEVVMADGSHHLYGATDEWAESAPGVHARVYDWRGRLGGPRASGDEPERT
ncbi:MULTISPECIES: hypothetical protein [unclassified Modestobacter]